MAVFTFIANTIATALGGKFFATLVGSIIAGGLAYGTARALGVFKPPELDQGLDPGVTIQLPPATDNKLPVLYGNVFTSGPIFDAAISNENQTMTYCIALSEETQTGTFSCDKVFMNDVELGFTGNTVTSHIDPNQSSNTTYANKVRLNIYQGGSSGSDVVFPASGTGNTTAATAIVPHWGANHTANNMVYAVLQIDYDAENGLTGLPQMTFKMRNTLSNPGDVLYDYLSDTRYGCGLTNAQIDISSITGTANTQMKGYCAEQVNYVNQANATVTHDRYNINGMLSTFDTCSTNIDKICQAAATFFTYNVKQGQFAAIPNRALSTAEKANCLVYNDDNIVSKIDISSTELYALYNGVEIEYADSTIKDQLNTVKVETPAGDRNANEPENVLKYKLDMVNDNMRAEALANIDLNQSRVSTVIQFVADYSGLQTDVGDVIKITNSLYGWTNKLFRVLRCTERQDETGMITVELSAMEYSDDYYTETPINQNLPRIPIDLPRIPIIQPMPIPIAFSDQGYSNVGTLPGAVFGNVITNDGMKTFGAGTQVEDAGLDSNTYLGGDMTNVSGVYEDIIAPAEYDIKGIDIGEYSYDAFGTPGGLLTGPFDLGFKTFGNITFSNSTSTSTANIGGGGQAFFGFDTPISTVTSQTKFNADPTAYGLASDFVPESLNVQIQGFSTISSNVSFPRKIGNMKYQIFRVTKGEK